MATCEQYRLPGTLRDVYCAVWRHKGKVLCCVALAVTTAVAANLLTPASYRSESKLFLRLGRENVILDPTATMTEKPLVVAPASREDELNSVVENLTSRRLVEKVVDAIGPATILEEGNGSPGSDQPGVANTIREFVGRLRGLAGGVALTPRDSAILHLEKHLDISPVRKSNVVTAAYEAEDPTLARNVLARLVDLYQEEHVRLNRPAGANKFFAEQAARTRSALTQTEERILALKQKTDMALPREQQKQLVAQRGQLESERLTVARELTAAETKVKAMEEQLKVLPEHQTAAQLTGQGDEGTNRMRDRFFALQMAEKDAAAVYKPEHPKLVRIREQIEAAKKTLDQEQRTTTQTTTAPNRAYEDVRSALLRERTALAAMQTKAHSLDRQLADLRARSRAFEEDSLRLARLEREAELLENSYRQYAMNLEKTRVDEALEASRISNVCISQPATYNPRPIRPRKLANLLFGLMAGVCGGVGLALLAEHLDQSIRSPEEIETELKMPVLLSIPRLKRRPLPINVRN